MPVCSNIDCQAHTLTQLSLWVNNLWLEGGGEYTESSRLRRGCKYMPALAIVNGGGASLMSRPAMVSRVGQWQLCVQSPGVGRVGFGA